MDSDRALGPDGNVFGLESAVQPEKDSVIRMSRMTRLL